MRKMSILGEQGALEEKHLYRLASGMAAGGKQEEETQLIACLFIELLISAWDTFKKVSQVCLRNSWRNISLLS